MVSDDEVLAEIDAAFGRSPRPEHFTDYTHCDECAEHDDLLRSRDRASLQLTDINNPGWDPICFCSPEGIAYLMPALARFALKEPQEGTDWYGRQLLFHLYQGAEYNAFHASCSDQQRRAISSLLGHFVETRASLAEFDADDLLRAHEIWSRASELNRP